MSLARCRCVRRWQAQNTYSLGPRQARSSSATRAESPYNGRSNVIGIAIGAAGTLTTASVCYSWPRVAHADNGGGDKSWFSTSTWFASHAGTAGSKSSTSHDEPDHCPGLQSPPSQTKEHTDYARKDALDIALPEPSAWQSSSDWLSSLGTRLTSWNFADIGDKMSDAILPLWAKLLPGYIRKLQDEMSMSPGSLADEIWQEANDPECNPEIVWDATVRVAEGICPDEKAFVRKRRYHTRAALAKYLGISENQIHPDDVPTIAMCGSGGGLRALVAGTSSYLCAQQAGLYDCVTYTAGVSGSCWLQALYYSSIGRQDYTHIIEHLKHRLGVHIAFPPAALGLLSSAPTNKYLLCGIVEKLKGVPDADFGIVDVYGLLLAARLMVPRGDLGIDYLDLKISDQERFIKDGKFPLPIYTAVRHEIPKEAIEEKTTSELREQAKREAWFQWFEWTPYEFFCEELGAGIPTFAVGREFDRGISIWRDNGLALPEVRLPTLLGIYGSAFCATLSHYYKEIQPLVKGLAGFGGIDQLIKEKDEELVKVHPIDPATIPNFARNMKDLLPSTCPESIREAKHLQLMDAGMSNNLPIYPLLRPGRDVDVIITFDASADVKKDNWLKVADGYVRQRGITGWPLGAGWPSEHESPQDAAKDLDSAQAKTEQDAAQHLEQAQKQPVNPKAKESNTRPSDLGFCNVWVGSKEERTYDSEPPASKVVDQDWELMQPDAGVTVIYFPFIPNPKVEGVDPHTSDFMSTWNFVYTPEEVEKVVDLARANFTAGEEQTKRTIRAVWQRKRQQRLEREKQQRDSRWTLNLAKINR